MKALCLFLFPCLLTILSSGCAAPGAVRMFEDLQAEFRADLAVVGELRAEVTGLKVTQQAGGNINDPWVGRIAVFGGPPMSIVFYMVVVRTMRRRWNVYRDRRTWEKQNPTCKN